MSVTANESSIRDAMKAAKENLEYSFFTQAWGYPESLTKCDEDRYDKEHNAARGGPYIDAVTAAEKKMEAEFRRVLIERGAYDQFAEHIGAALRLTYLVWAREEVIQAEVARGAAQEIAATIEPSDALGRLLPDSDAVPGARKRFLAYVRNSGVLEDALHAALDVKGSAS